jgi:hypothetical protein
LINDSDIRKTKDVEMRSSSNKTKLRPIKSSSKKKRDILRIQGDEDGS